MTRVLVLLAVLPLSGCLAAWAATFPAYYEVTFPAEKDRTTLPAEPWVCIKEPHEAIIYCASLADELMTAVRACELEHRHGR